MNQLLVPIDFSVESDHALEIACKIAIQEDAIVDALNIFKVPKPHVSLSDFDNITYQKEASELNWKRMTAYLSHPKFDGVKIRMNQVQIGENDDLAEVIAEMSVKNQSEMVVMGNKLVSGMLEVINGSIASSTMKGVTVPFLSIKGFLPFSKIKNIVYTSEFEEGDDKHFSFVKMVANLFDAKVNFLYVKDEENDSQLFEKELLHKMKAMVEKWGISSVSLNIRESEFIQSGIEDFSKEINADLIVVGYHADRKHKHELQGSLAEDFIHSFKQPVLTIKY